MPNYASVRDDVVLLLGSAARNGDGNAKNLREFIPKNLPECPPTWIHQIAKDLDSRGLGTAQFSIKEILFFPSGACIEAADEIAASRTFRGKLKRISRSDWIAIAAFVVSIIALFKKA